MERERSSASAATHLPSYSPDRRVPAAEQPYKSPHDQETNTASDRGETPPLRFSQGSREKPIILFSLDLTPTGIETGRTTTGFSIAVDQIASIIPQYTYSELFVSCSALQNQQIQVAGQYTLLARNPWLILRHGKLKDTGKALALFSAAKKLPLKQRLRLAKRQLNVGLYAYQIRKTKARVAFIHSYLPHVIPFVEAALRTNTPIVLTCHAAYDNTKHDFTTDFARFLLQTLLPHGVLATGVSSGITAWSRAQVESQCRESIFHIAYPLPPTPKAQKKEGRKQGYRILISGNIGERKNQAQALRAIALLPPEKKANLSVLIIGNDTTQGAIKELAEKLEIDSFCRFAGQVPRDEALRYAAEADLILSATISEGFGLPFLEGYAQGVPAVFFSDIDAAKELGDPRCAVMAQPRTDQALSEAIAKAMDTQWDKQYIINSVQSYNAENIARQYHAVLKKAGKPTLTEKAWDKSLRRFLKKSNLSGKLAPQR